jgi:septal ring factor EnvC (AmiA/AmiB activator)
MASDEALWEQLSNRRRRLESTQAELYVQKKKLLEVETALEDRIADMDREKRRRKEILSRIRRDKTLQLAAIHSLKDAAAELERVLQGLRERPPAAEQPPPEGKTFTELKGLLPLPVRGKIVNCFGKYRNPRFNVVNFRSGIDIRADRGEPIHAVGTGTVLYAEWFKGYGNMIIIDHGSFYYTLYAHAEELFKQKGEGVDPGEVIATVGDTGSMTGPSLYFEIRHDGKPLDPADWLRQG